MRNGDTASIGQTRSDPLPNRVRWEIKIGNLLTRI